MSILFCTFVCRKRGGNQVQTKQTPKSREGKEKMNKLEMKMKGLIEAVREETKKEILEFLYARHMAIQKLLENGWPILETTYGERFTKMYEQRRKLHRKQDLLIELSNEIIFKI